MLVSHTKHSRKALLRGSLAAVACLLVVILSAVCHRTQWSGGGGGQDLLQDTPVLHQKCMLLLAVCRVLACQNMYDLSPA